MAIPKTHEQAGLEEFPAEALARADEIIARYKGKPGALIPVLEEVQNVLGYLPVSIQMRVARGLNIPPSNVYGVVTFYSFFTMVPKGRHTAEGMPGDRLLRERRAADSQQAERCAGH